MFRRWKRAGKATISILIFALFITSTVSAHPMDPVYVNSMLEVVQTPSLHPAGSGTIILNISNPYDNLTMSNISFTAEIYAYSTLSTYIPIEDIEYPPLLKSPEGDEGVEITLDRRELISGENWTVEIPVWLQKESPHGAVFEPGSYFIRLSLNFTLGNESYLLLSRGYMPPEAQELLSTPGLVLNHSVISSFGFDAVIPDTAFSVVVPVPHWPFYALVAAGILLGVGALLSYVDDNPGAFPAIERRYIWLRGKYRAVRALRREQRKKRG